MNWTWYLFFVIPKYCFFCLHTFSVILCPWNYRKCVAETLFNKIISTIDILKLSSAVCLSPYLLFWKINKKNQHSISWILLIVLNSDTNLWISLHLALITHEALKSMNSSIFQHFTGTGQNWSDRSRVLNSYISYFDGYFGGTGVLP